jgi:hypothetical protein
MRGHNQAAELPFRPRKHYEPEHVRSLLADFVCDECKPEFYKKGLDSLDYTDSDCSFFECGECNRNWPVCSAIERLNGRRCPLCAHAIEIELLPAAHDETDCWLCYAVDYKRALYPLGGPLG